MNSPDTRMVLQSFPGYANDIVLVKRGAEGESRVPVGAIISGDHGLFEVNTPIYEGDVVEIPDPRGGVRHEQVQAVKHVGRGVMDHLKVTWVSGPTSIGRTVNNFHGTATIIGQKGGDINNYGSLRAGDGGPGGPGGSINQRAGDGGNSYSFANPNQDREAFFRDLVSAIQAGRDDEDDKKEALALVEKAKAEPAWDKSVKRVKAALGLIKDGAAIWGLLAQQGWFDGVKHLLG